MHSWLKHTFSLPYRDSSLAEPHSRNTCSSPTTDPTHPTDMFTTVPTIIKTTATTTKHFNHAPFKKKSTLLINPDISAKSIALATVLVWKTIDLISVASSDQLMEGQPQRRHSVSTNTSTYTQKKPFHKTPLLQFCTPPSSTSNTHLLLGSSCLLLAPRLRCFCYSPDSKPCSWWSSEFDPFLLTCLQYKLHPLKNPYS